MNNKELNFISQEGEGLKIEFKENINNIDKDMVAFANTEGGRLFVGINDKKHIIGINTTRGIS
ncbi:ATP-binding protein [Candidatus Saganbacteria bacterium]|nr:ATP-binding protein [Candidatus Saganbacteria bacterium]